MSKDKYRWLPTKQIEDHIFNPGYPESSNSAIGDALPQSHAQQQLRLKLYFIENDVGGDANISSVLFHYAIQENKNRISHKVINLLSLLQ